MTFALPPTLLRRKSVDDLPTTHPNSRSALVRDRGDGNRGWNRAVEIEATPDGLTPLEHAAARGYIEIVQCLVEHGAHINTCVDGRTPLQLAAKHGHLDVVRYLCKKGAVVNGKLQEPPASTLPEHSLAMEPEIVCPNDFPEIVKKDTAVQMDSSDGEGQQPKYIGYRAHTFLGP